MSALHQFQRALALSDPARSEQQYSDSQYVDQRAV